MYPWTWIITRVRAKRICIDSINLACIVYWRLVVRISMCSWKQVAQLSLLFRFIHLINSCSRNALSTKLYPRFKKSSSMKIIVKLRVRRHCSNDRDFKLINIVGSVDLNYLAYRTNNGCFYICKAVGLVWSACVGAVWGNIVVTSRAQTV